ncbi:MAG: hypothetical protein LBR88_08630 [Zoogloeaceae bacterium]|nr:hypothetical protein [Zoogloeaceae bacterium]
MKSSQKLVLGAALTALLASGAAMGQAACTGASTVACGIDNTAGGVGLGWDL